MIDLDRTRVFSKERGKQANPGYHETGVGWHLEIQGRRTREK